MKRLILRGIRWYKATEGLRNELARSLGLPLGGCRFRPTCSEYMYSAVEKYGLLKGILMGLWRIMRCGPWSKGGYDPVR